MCCLCICRFPYLLQEDANLLCTLNKQGWQVDPKTSQVLWVYSQEEARGTSYWKIKPSSKPVKKEW